MQQLKSLAVLLTDKRLKDMFGTCNTFFKGKVVMEAMP